jgi:hypothetical protein
MVATKPAIIFERSAAQTFGPKKAVRLALNWRVVR